MAVNLCDGLRAAGFLGSIESKKALAALTTWKIGGPAELLIEPTDVDDLRRAISFAAEIDRPWRVLGNGSNLLVSDAGVPGLVIRIRKSLNTVEFDGARLTVGAGAMFPAVARLAASRGLSGIEFGAGIPGTLGGAIVMNAGWHEFEIGNLVESVRFMRPDGTVLRHARSACDFGYRQSAFRERPGIVVGAELRLLPGRAEEISARLEGFAASRKANQPTDLPSCGSVFLKPPDDFAGRLIEQAGLKGHRVGGLEVSTLHANFFVNLDGGTSEQALELVRLVEQEVERQFGVRLVREFDCW